MTHTYAPRLTSIVASAFIAASFAPRAVVNAQTPSAPGAAPAKPTAASNAAPARTAAQTQDLLHELPIVRERLANGLRVVMSPNHEVPTIAIAVYYDVGSRNELKGASGFAHLFEHMMFQGSANVGKGEHFSLIINRGGTLNGTTNADRTNYFETLPSNELALGLWLEADRMRSLAVTRENFENQRATVMEERRQRIDNRPYIPSMLRINELAYGNFWPYAHSTIGDMQDLERAPLSAVQAFFNDYYTPNNAVLSIAGDFEPAAAMELVKKYFGAIEARQVPPYKPPPFEPPAQEQHEQMTDNNAELPAFHMAYPIPPVRTLDHYPLELLALILGDGESARLYTSIVKHHEAAVQVSVSTDDRRGPDLFSIWTVVSGKSTIEGTRKLIEDQLERVVTQGITPRELEKAKNRVRSALVFGLESNLSRAMQLGEFELYHGDAALLRDELAKYLAVQPADIQRVARTYLTKVHRTLLDVVPAPANVEGAAEQPVGKPSIGPKPKGGAAKRKGALKTHLRGKNKPSTPGPAKQRGTNP